MENRMLSPEEIKRVKGLGCLRDKRYNDVFNVRVITVNGKLTQEKLKAVAEASRIYGSGEVSMTVRQTLEIQGVKYDNLDKLFEYLKENGLESGGTGPKVRPVVSCKGTTCQYGLIDTYSLSQKIHERFYKGYRDVILPHKFKIAVGGCPNNCVKPELNDIGIIGECSPVVSEELCKGCKKCSVKESCPMDAMNLSDGVIECDYIKCNGCGRCTAKCPFGAVKAYDKAGYTIYIGGRWGKKTDKGIDFYTARSQDEVLDIIEKLIIFYKNEGLEGERFADTVKRLNKDFYIQEKVLWSKE